MCCSIFVISVYIQRGMASTYIVCAQQEEDYRLHFAVQPSGQGQIASLDIWHIHIVILELRDQVCVLHYKYIM